VKKYLAVSVFVLTLTGIIQSSAAADSSASAVAANKKEISMTADDVQQRGKQLRAEIEKRYQELLQNNTLKQSNPINDVVTKYIHPGTSFDDAEQVLRDAGFKVSHKSFQPKSNGLSATIKLDTPWFVKSEAIIDIASRNQEDNYVWDVSAAIVYKSL
jgi:hypothetical protein